MATRTVFPYTVYGDYNLAVRAAGVCAARCLRELGKPVSNAQNGAYGQGLVKDMVLIKQHYNLRGADGKIDPRVIGQAAWEVLWKWAGPRENDWVVKRLVQIKDAQALAGDARLRSALLNVANRFLAIRNEFVYAQIRPFPADGLFDLVNRRRYDCSSTVISLYRSAGVPVDPSGFRYEGWGDTGALWNQGRRVEAADIATGDLCFYGWETDPYPRPRHVTMAMTDGMCVSFGSTPPSYRDIHYRSDFIGARRYF